MDITVDEFVLFCERSITEMRRALARCDAEQLNALPDLPAPNSPFQLVTHALAACEYWTAHVVAGHPTDRVRDSEFAATGTRDELDRQADALVSRLRDLAPELQAATTLANGAHTTLPLGHDWTVGTALIHAYEELTQHLGHLEITVDLVTR